MLHTLWTNVVTPVELIVLHGIPSLPSLSLILIICTLLFELRRHCFLLGIFFQSFFRIAGQDRIVLVHNLYDDMIVDGTLILVSRIPILVS